MTTQSIDSLPIIIDSLPIKIADNSCGKLIIGDDNITEADLNRLSKYSGEKIKDIIENNKNLLFFPHSFKDIKDIDNDSVIYTIIGNNKIRTGNILGFIGIGQTQLQIHSRFDEGTDTNYFLHYMLQKVFAINLFDWEHTSGQDDIFNFLLYLFPNYLKQAYNQGLFKQYQTFNHNDSNVRGRIDLSRHIRQNIPFVGNVAYQTRKYTYDNAITQLIRHTIEYISNTPIGKAILNNDTDTRDAVNAIRQATPSYNPNDKKRIINNNLRPMVHPYYDKYTKLQKLCLRILRHEKLSYDNADTNKIHGILFDGAWLWEEYLAKIITDFTHPQNKEKKGGIHLFQNPKSGIRYPDFYKINTTTDNSNKDTTTVIDAKYKKTIKRDDLHQIVTYMYILQAKTGGFIFPFNDINNATLQDEDDNESAINISNDPKELSGYNGKIYFFGLKIPSSDTWKNFVKAMESTEQELRTTLV